MSVWGHFSDFGFKSGSPAVDFCSLLVVGFSSFEQAIAIWRSCPPERMVLVASGLQNGLFWRSCPPERVVLVASGLQNVLFWQSWIPERVVLVGSGLQNDPF